MRGVNGCKEFLGFEESLKFEEFLGFEESLESNDRGGGAHPHYAAAALANWLQ